MPLWVDADEALLPEYDYRVWARCSAQREPIRSFVPAIVPHEFADRCFDSIIFDFCVGAQKVKFTCFRKLCQDKNRDGNIANLSLKGALSPKIGQVMYLHSLWIGLDSRRSMATMSSHISSRSSRQYEDPSKHGCIKVANSVHFIQAILCQGHDNSVH